MPRALADVVTYIPNQLPDGYDTPNLVGSGSFCTVALVRAKPHALALLRVQGLCNDDPVLQQRLYAAAAREILATEHLKGKILQCPEMAGDMILPQSWHFDVSGRLTSIFGSNDMGLCDLFAVMANVRDKNLWCVKNSILLHPEDILSCSIQAVNGMRFLHEKNLGHFDLKAENLFVTPQGAVKIGDWGSLWFLGQSHQGFLGTASLTPPEYVDLLQDRSATVELAASADVYSLGSMISALLTGPAPIFVSVHGDPSMPHGEDVVGRLKVLARGGSRSQKLYRAMVQTWTSPPHSIKEAAAFKRLSWIVPMMMKPLAQDRPTMAQVMPALLDGELTLYPDAREKHMSNVRDLLDRCFGTETLRKMRIAQFIGNTEDWCDLTWPIRFTGEAVKESDHDARAVFKQRWKMMGQSREQPLLGAKKTLEMAYECALSEAISTDEESLVTEL